MKYGRTWGPDRLHPFDPEDFYELDPKEADQVTREWVDTIANRVALLESSVRGTPEFGDWRADRTRDSLAPLPRWVSKSLIMIPNTPEQIEVAVSSRKGLSQEGKTALRTALSRRWAFDDAGYGQALVIDVATYIGECIRQALPKLTWKRQSRESGLESFNSPCLLSPSGRSALCPSAWRALLSNLRRGLVPGTRRL